MSVVCKEGRGGKGRVRRGIVHIYGEKRDARVSRSEKKCSGVTGECKLASMRHQAIVYRVLNIAEDIRVNNQCFSICNCS